ncbi:hypothetical protein SAMN05216503_3246 [Polaribacter sp. KT25b]|uniref:hypothetical protein n=1 Tax=Polaribacter sp. KT25b TaxID=1855336 RepID=UPI00087AC7E7|nr:hypothetical protein [Polaribacter sp. KT25b]SDS49621.1 hypothetical protein SAMN05216503_3246 [Polaribacter sp. KT25b]
MELSKEQIQYIDHRLENDGVKYWEIRIEMLDHIVSDVEKNLQPENTDYQFKELVQNAFVTLGWKENFNGSSFPNNDKDTFKNVNNEYRKMYLQGFINFFKKPLNFFLFTLFCLILFSLSEFLNLKTFKRVSIVFFILPLIGSLFELFKTSRNKYGKSIHRDFGVTYLTMSFLIFNFIIQSVTNDSLFEMPIEYHKTILLFTIPFHLILSFSGYQVYKKSIRELEQMRKELLS